MPEVQDRIEKLGNSILSDAQKKAEEIISKAQQQADELTEQARDCLLYTSPSPRD